MGLLTFTSRSGDGVRTPAVAGTFYPADADELRREVESYLQRAKAPEVKEPILAALAPHAGYHYSAQVAAYVHQAIRDVPFDTLVVIGHDSHAKGIVAILPKAKTFTTPLGEVAVDTELAKAMVEHSRRIIYHEPAHARDHTIEVHLPFLQVLGRTCQVLPVLFGEPTVEHVEALVEALRTCRGDRRLFILASTDLCHYPPAQVARELDAKTLDKVKGLDPKELFSYLDEHRSGRHGVQTAMCASGGVATAIEYAKADGNAEFRLLKTANSGDVGGDQGRVVGYAAGLFVRAPAAKKEAGFSLPKDVCQELLALARRRIETAVDGERLDYQPPAAMAKVMREPAAVFATLHLKGRLRGCIGTTVAREPLWQAVYGMAHSAAFHDPRFAAVTRAEVGDLHIEISVLSPPVPVKGPDDIVPKKHGVIVHRGHQSGLFLPQVWEQLPDKEEFLTILCQQKAHLPGNAWRDGSAQLSVFTVFAFAENE
jgi:AmmeMemoRadiSam system protein B/AmmeMemoRadiSam system protein A